MLHCVGYNLKMSLYCHVCNCRQYKQHFSIKCVDVSMLYPHTILMVCQLSLSSQNVQKMFAQLRSSYCTFPNENVIIINIVYS